MPTLLKDKPPPRTDDVHLQCDPAGFTLTLPPDRGMAVFGVVMGIVSSCLLGWVAFHIGLPRRAESLAVWVACSVVVGAMWLGVALGLAASVQGLRSRQTRTTISVRGDVLECTVPGAFGLSIQRLPLADLAGAEMHEVVDSDGRPRSPDLAVRRRDGTRVKLLSAVGYDLEHVEYAAEVLKEWLGDAAAMRAAAVCDGRPCPRCGARPASQPSTSSHHLTSAAFGWPPSSASRTDR